MASAETQARADVTPLDWTSRILAGAAYVWTVLLVLQNVGILATLIGDGLPSGDPVMSDLAALAAARIGLLCAGVVAFKWRPGLWSSAFYVTSILFAFPLGLFLQDWLTDAPTHPVQFLLTLSAVCSYVAALCVAAVYFRTREVARRPIAVEAFD